MGDNTGVMAPAYWLEYLRTYSTTTGQAEEIYTPGAELCRYSVTREDTSSAPMAVSDTAAKPNCRMAAMSRGASMSSNSDTQEGASDRMTFSCLPSNNFVRLMPSRIFLAPVGHTCVQCPQ